jgi:dTDP-4-dehydrorhamnose reductase
MKSKKIIILGGNGMLGHMLATFLLSANTAVICIVRNKPGFEVEYIIDDFLDYVKITKIIDLIKPDYIVNCVGLLIEDSKKNPKEAIRINSHLPWFLEKYYSTSSTRIIQISTDCVFSGEQGPYPVSAIPDAKDIYGITKALGEIINSKDLTIRTSIIGPNIGSRKTGLFDWFFFNKFSVKGYTNVYWSGVTTLQLAKVIFNAIEFNISGLINVSNNIALSKYDLLKIIDSVFFDSKRIIISDNLLKTNKSLIPSSYQYNITIPGYSEMIFELKEWIYSNPLLYNDYLGC